LVAGDFNNDGKDDIAAFFQGTSSCDIHLWYSRGSYFDYDGVRGTEYTAYFLNYVENRMVTGDFDGDGYDDIAAMRSGTNGRPSIHVWLYDAPYFYHEEWYLRPNNGYYLSNVDDRMVAGDFDGDGYDDIATFYDNSNGASRIHVWLSDGTAFDYVSPTGWWDTTSGYTISCVDSRMVAGDFDEDGKDDIATFYNYGSGACRIHVWLSDGSSFDYEGSSGWWATYSNYDLSNVENRMIAGDFDGDGLIDISTFYETGTSSARINVWLSDGYSFDEDGSINYGGWWSTI
jgi:hypothetical protein